MTRPRVPAADLYTGEAGRRYRALVATGYSARRAHAAHLRGALAGWRPRSLLLVGVGDAATEVEALRLLPSVDDVTCHDLDPEIALAAVDRVVALRRPARVDADAGPLRELARTGARYDGATLLGYTVGNDERLLDEVGDVARELVLDAPLADRENDARAAGRLGAEEREAEAAWFEAGAAEAPRYVVEDRPDGYEILALGRRTGRVIMTFRRRTDEGWRACFAAHGWRVEAADLTSTAQRIAVYRLRRSDRSGG